jgi:hypothetical protein
MRSRWPGVCATDTKLFGFGFIQLAEHIPCGNAASVLL